ncbi:MAG: pyridoxamine 5'-phosphate oxidase family protein [Gammaproteobacteria bacterium]|nr:pyridoxamine 5'-phosphate oxidase family protein [Gammaproteobacteria bacterium]
MKIDHIRREFSTPPLLIDDLPSNPYDVFHSWFFDVLHAKIEDPTACVFATADENNIPDTRVVLLKSFSDERFVFSQIIPVERRTFSKKSMGRHEFLLG